MDMSSSEGHEQTCDNEHILLEWCASIATYQDICIVYDVC